MEYDDYWKDEIEFIEVLQHVFGKENVIVWGCQMEGTVSKIIADKGYGFIRGEDGKEYFFHQTDVQGFFADMADDIENGRRVPVVFDVVQSPKGSRASKVTRIDGGV